MTPAASTAAASTTNTYRRPARRSRSSWRASPTASVPTPNSAPLAPSASASTPSVAFTIWALVVSTFGGLYSLPCLMRIRSESNAAPLLHRPSHTTGAPVLEQPGRVTAVHDRDRLLAVGHLEADTLRGLRDRARHHRARDPQAASLLTRAVRDRLRHRAEEDDVLRQRDGEHDDRHDRSATDGGGDDRASLPARARRRRGRRRWRRRRSVGDGHGSGLSPGGTGSGPGQRAPGPARAPRDRRPVPGEHDGREHPTGDDVAGVGHGRLIGACPSRRARPARRRRTRPARRWPARARAPPALPRAPPGGTACRGGTRRRA